MWAVSTVVSGIILHAALGVANATEPKQADHAPICFAVSEGTWTKRPEVLFSCQACIPEQLQAPVSEQLVVLMGYLNHSQWHNLA